METSPQPTNHQPMAKKPILVISSHVVRGSVGNRAAVLALEAIGHEVWALPTVVLPWHPGHGKATKIVADDTAFDSLISDLEKAPWLNQLGAILTGYLGNASQAHSIARLIKKVQKNNPEVLYLCDPVIGDDHGLYIGEETARAIKNELLPLANITTPNRFEYEWLTGAKYTNNIDMVKASNSLSCEKLIITSAYPMLANSIANLMITSKKVFLAEHRLIGNAPNGLGDLTSALILANKLAGFEDERNLSRTTASVFEILARTAKVAKSELAIESNIDSLRRPMAHISMRSLLHPNALPSK